MRPLSKTADGTTYFHEEDGTTYIGTITDVSSTVDKVQELRHLPRSALGDHIASIPLDLLDQWAKKFRLEWMDVAEDEALFDRFLSEHGKLKIAGGWQ